MADDFEGYARVAQAIRTPVVGGENNWCLHDSRPFFGTGVRTLQPDLMRGGYTGLREIAQAAHGHGITIAPHLFPELASHLVASIPNPSWLEYMGWHDHLWVQPVKPQGGMVIPPDRPGHGMDFRPELFREHPYRDRG